MRIIRDAEACYGCRRCELACSFHHGGAFSPELSSIKVARHNRIGQVEWSIGSTCDSCKGETQALCVKYCAYGALKEVK